MPPSSKRSKDQTKMQRHRQGRKLATCFTVLNHSACLLMLHRRLQIVRAGFRSTHTGNPDQGSAGKKVYYTGGVPPAPSFPYTVCSHGLCEQPLTSTELRLNPFTQSTPLYYRQGVAHRRACEPRRVDCSPYRPSEGDSAVSASTFTIAPAEDLAHSFADGQGGGAPAVVSPSAPSSSPSSKSSLSGWSSPSYSSGSSSSSMGGPCPAKYAVPGSSAPSYACATRASAFRVYTVSRALLAVGPCPAKYAMPAPRRAPAHARFERQRLGCTQCQGPCLL